MATPDILDFEALLAPIPGDSPTGRDIRWDEVYDELDRARQSQSADMLSDEVVEADWPLVLRRGQEVLQNDSKDLRIASWMTEALVDQHGFAGLRDALRLVTQLLEQHWGGLFPLPDDEDPDPYEGRAAAILHIAEIDRGALLPNRVRQVALAPSPPGEDPYSWEYWKSRQVGGQGESEEDDAFARRSGEAQERERLFEEAVAAMGVDHYLNIHEDILACGEAIGELRRVLLDTFDAGAPGVEPLADAVDDCRVLVRRILNDKGAFAEEEAEGDAELGEGEGGDQAGGTPGVSGPIKSRADALKRLNEVASYFRRAEPHSPISYLVERAAKWGNMSLERVLDELVKDPTARDQINELLGVQREEMEE